jgi:hypothetical protein
MRLPVVGVSNYQPTLLAVTGAPREGEFRWEGFAVLVPEPDNPHDPNAVMVQIERAKVGYLSRANARLYLPQLRAMIRAGQTTMCDAFVGRGGDNPNLGVSLLVPFEWAGD